MIRNSFIFLEKIGPTAENNIWKQNITTWDKFTNTERIKGVSPTRKSYYDRQIKQASNYLKDYNSEAFTKILPKSENWRLFNHFCDDAIYLDIETTGYYGDITVCGLYDGNDTKMLIKGQNLTKSSIKEAFHGKKLLVTFNGQSFDIPVINRYFKGVIPNIPHLDLRFPLAKLGYTGGLKNIEKNLKIKRNNDVDGFSGSDAVELWFDYIENNNKRSLKLLLQYNEEDIVNLKPLAQFVAENFKKKLLKQHVN